MAPKRRSWNPFYPLSVVIGVAFLVTACAYGVMAFRGANPQMLPPGEETPLMQFLSKHGATLFLVELALLMLATIAAIATDGYWSGDEEAGGAEQDTEEAGGGNAARGEGGGEEAGDGVGDAKWPSEAER